MGSTDVTTSALLKIQAEIMEELHGRGVLWSTNSGYAALRTVVILVNSDSISG